MVAFGSGGWSTTRKALRPQWQRPVVLSASARAAGAQCFPRSDGRVSDVVNVVAVVWPKGIIASVSRLTSRPVYSLRHLRQTVEYSTN